MGYITAEFGNQDQSGIVSVYHMNQKKQLEKLGLSGVVGLVFA